MQGSWRMSRGKEAEVRRAGGCEREDVEDVEESGR